MKDLGNWALDNRKLIYFLVAVLTIGGVFAYYDMSKLEDPEIKVKQAAVVTVYPGASAHQVELEVTDVLEKSIRSMKDIGEVTSRSMNDMSLINVSLSTLVTNEETEQCWDILRRKVADVQAELPEGASVSVVMDDFGDVFGMFYAMTFDGYTDAEAARYAELVKKEVMKIEGISKVNIYGQRPECIYIELYEDKLANLGVHPAEVLATLNGQNKTVYSGYYESGGSRLRVTVNDRYRTTEDIGSLLLQGHEDDQLRLRDIASVTEGYENPVRNELRYDGRRALGISISALSGTDITKIGRQVERTLERLENERMPAGMEIHEVFFQPEKVEAALDSFLINLVESVLIVVVLLMFAMGFRSGVILGFNLLVTVLGSLMILNVFDGSLQRVSLASFVLAMGMLVDNAIVILDGIQVDMNVIAGSGLVGIVTRVGDNWAQVRAIIDDMSNVSAQVLSTSDLCFVKGDLQLMETGLIQISQLRDPEGEASIGDTVVTSHVSDKYHSGILIGYINELTLDSNNLTRSGTLTPAVDFEHLHSVLVITDLKQSVDVEE